MNWRRVTPLLELLLSMSNLMPCLSQINMETCASLTCYSSRFLSASIHIFFHFLRSYYNINSTNFNKIVDTKVIPGISGTPHSCVRVTPLGPVQPGLSNQVRKVISLNRASNILIHLWEKLFYTNEILGSNKILTNFHFLLARYSCTWEPLKLNYGISHSMIGIKWLVLSVICLVAHFLM